MAGERSRNRRIPGRRRHVQAVQRTLTAILERLTLAVAAAIAAMFLFTYVAHQMAEGETQKFDTAAVRFFGQHQSPFFHALMTAISWLAGPVPMTVTIVVSIVGFWRAGRLWPDGLALLVAGMGGVGLMIGLKALFHRPRPAQIFAHLGYSFPSGHSFFALTIYGMLAYWITHNARLPHRRLLWGAAVAAILLVGFSRVFLGVHYPSDVVAGLLVALPWLWGCLALLTWLHRRRGSIVAPTERPA